MNISSETDFKDHNLWKSICKEAMMILIEVIQGKIGKEKGSYMQEIIIWELKADKVISLYCRKIIIRGYSTKADPKVKVIKKFFWEIISNQVQLDIKMYHLNQTHALVSKFIKISPNQILMDLVQNCKDYVNKSRNKSTQ